MKKIRLFLLTSLFTILTLVATASAASACLVFHYQPELPKALRK
ncbi:MAG: cyclic lactone autoinducer peptide [Bacillota bacterium]